MERWREELENWREELENWREELENWREESCWSGWLESDLYKGREHEVRFGGIKRRK